MMARTQITLDRELLKRARLRASELGISLAELFRRAVSRDLGRVDAKAHVTAVFNLGSSRGSNIARNKQSMLGEAFCMN